MIFRVFSIFDSKAVAFLPPFFLPESGQAVRAFSDSCKDKAHAFGQHPEDYTLFQIGEFDDGTGELVKRPEHINLGVGVSFLSESNS